MWIHRKYGRSCHICNDLPCFSAAQCFFPHAWYVGTETVALVEPFLNSRSLWRDWRSRLSLCSSWWALVNFLCFISTLTLSSKDKMKVRILTRYFCGWKENINALSVVNCVKLTVMWCNSIYTATLMPLCSNLCISVGDFIILVLYNVMNQKE